MQIVDALGSGVTEFVFEVDGDTLKIRLASEDGYAEFTKNEDEQRKILEELKVWEEIALEEERLQEEIDSIQAQIDSYWNEVAELQGNIDWNISAIETNQSDIVNWEENIEQAYLSCQESIDNGGDREYNENQRDDFIAAYNEAIQGCNERIMELKNENTGYQNEIDLIIGKIDNLEREIEELRENI